MCCSPVAGLLGSPGPRGSATCGRGGDQPNRESTGSAVKFRGWVLMVGAGVVDGCRGG